METDEIPWQHGFYSAASATKALLETGAFRDVVFKVGRDGDVEEIPAHRAILAIRSPVFERMFYGSLPEKEYVEVPDASPRAFCLMLRYVYTDDDREVDESNIIQMYKVAHKYDILPLVKICAIRSRQCISMRNLGQFLEMNETYEDETIEKHLERFIQKNSWRIFHEQEYYLDLTEEHLLRILTDIPKSVPEIDIYVGVVAWGKAELERRQGLGDFAGTLREVLEKTLAHFCFPRMRRGEFRESAEKDGVFSLEEIDQISIYMAGAQGAEPPFGRALPGLRGSPVGAIDAIHSPSDDTAVKSQGRPAEPSRQWGTSRGLSVVMAQVEEASHIHLFMDSY